MAQLTKHKRLFLAAWLFVMHWMPSVVGATDAPESTLQVPRSDATLNIIVPCPASDVTAGDDALRLKELDAEGIPAPLQIIPAIASDGTVASDKRRLVVAIPPRDSAPKLRRFVLAADTAEPTPDAAKQGFQFKSASDLSLGLWEGERPVLVYNHGTLTDPDVPKNDSRRKRGCYIHPVWGLDGERITDDFPRDHYHHHGIFWAWPHVKIDGKDHNLWTYRTIEPRFVRWLCREAGPVAAVLGVENGWFVGDKKVMIERVWIQVHRASGDHRAIDLSFTWIPIDRPITLQGAGGKSYGGLTMRFAMGQRNDATIRVSTQDATSVPSKQDHVNKPLAWADLTSKFDAMRTRSGAAIFLAPDHPDFPPTWLTRHYGALCVGWPGVKGKTFAAGEPIRTDYRVWIHRDDLPVQALQQAYDRYGIARQAKWRTSVPGE